MVRESVSEQAGKESTSNRFAQPNDSPTSPQHHTNQPNTCAYQDVMASYSGMGLFVEFGSQLTSPMTVRRRFGHLSTSSPVRKGGMEP